MKQLLYSLIIFSFYFSSTTFSQNPEWIFYDTENSGLPDNNITCIENDEFGNMWIGTGNGLVKYDGTDWIVYNSTNSELPSNSVACITIDESGNKWIGTENGLAKYDETNWTVYDTSNSDLPSNHIKSIAIDESGNKWMGFGGGFWSGGEGLANFDGTNWAVYDTSNSDLPSNRIRSIVIDESGNKWIRCDWNTLVKLDTNNEIWTHYSDFPFVASIATDKHNNKWFGTENQGLVKLDYDDSTWTAYDPATMGFKDGYEEDSGCMCIAIDNSDNKWLGIGFEGWGSWYSGLAKFNSDDTTLIHYTTSNSQLPSEQIKCIAIDKHGNKWIGTGPAIEYPEDVAMWVGLAVFNEDGIVSVDENNNEKEFLPNEYVLSQNYPNPFNPITKIKYSIPKQSNVILKVFDILGSEVKTLVNNEQSQGHYEVEFDGTTLTSGIYFYRLQAGDFVETKKMILIK